MAAIDWSKRKDADLVAALLAGDERAFVWLVRKHGRNMYRVARGLVRTDEVARDVVQDTWQAVLSGLRGFRGEAALKTWIFRILTNRARRTAKKEARSLPFSALAREDAEAGDAEPTDRFTADGRWSSPVQAWRSLDPEDDTARRQAVAYLADVLETLPDGQKTVVTMRDVEGLESKEVCEMLGISEGNQRVLLHRGRARLRHALEQHEATGREG